MLELSKQRPMQVRQPLVECRLDALVERRDVGLEYRRLASQGAGRRQLATFIAAEALLISAAVSVISWLRPSISLALPTSMASDRRYSSSMPETSLMPSRIFALVVEIAFSLNGLGSYLVQSAQSNDFAVVQGISFVLVAAFVIINTVDGHQKVRNIRRDPRVTVTVADPQDPSDFVQLRGEVVDGRADQFSWAVTTYELLTGVLPTPGVAHAARELGAPAAVISASHNAFGDNGIKLFAPGGRKIPESLEREVEQELRALAVSQPEPGPEGFGVGVSSEHRTALDDYVAMLVDRDRRDRPAARRARGRPDPRARTAATRRASTTSTSARRRPRVRATRAASPFAHGS